MASLKQKAALKIGNAIWKTYNWGKILEASKAVVLHFFVAAEPSPKNPCGPLRFVNVYSIIKKFDLFAT